MVRAGASTELFIVQWMRGKGSSPGRVEGLSCTMLATARPSCVYFKRVGTTLNNRQKDWLHFSTKSVHANWSSYQIGVDEGKCTLVDISNS